MRHQHAEQELCHIKTMIDQLERLLQSDEHVMPTWTVMAPAYWRARIDGVLAAAQDLPLPIEAQASALFTKLASILSVEKTV